MGRQHARTEQLGQQIPRAALDIGGPVGRAARVDDWLMTPCSRAVRAWAAAMATPSDHLDLSARLGSRADGERQSTSAVTKIRAFSSPRRPRANGSKNIAASTAARYRPIRHARCSARACSRSTPTTASSPRGRRLGGGQRAVQQLATPLRFEHRGVGRHHARHYLEQAAHRAYKILCTADRRQPGLRDLLAERCHDRGERPLSDITALSFGVGSVTEKDRNARSRLALARFIASGESGAPSAAAGRTEPRFDDVRLRISRHGRMGPWADGWQRVDDPGTRFRTAQPGWR
jgi:hypothetical protein